MAITCYDFSIGTDALEGCFFGYNTGGNLSQ